MIQSLTVSNFLSWSDVTFKPQHVNVLVGRNNSGKTNLCKALQFLNATPYWELDKSADLVGIPRYALRKFGSDDPIVSFRVEALLPHKGEELRYTYELTVTTPDPRDTTPSIQVDREALWVAPTDSEPVQLLENTRDGVRLLHERNFFAGVEGDNYARTTAPRDATMLKRLYDLETNERANQFKRYLQSWQFYGLSDIDLRALDYVPTGVYLFQTGKNLSSVLFRLKQSDDRAYRRLIQLVQQAEPGLEALNFRGGGNEPNVAMYLVYADDMQVPAWTASSGNLRYLALAYVFVVSELLKQRPLIVIEEPENGLYVALLRQLVELASTGEYRPQVIFTSHSPYFIDLFDKSLDSVFCVSKVGSGSVLQPIDAGKAGELLDEMSLGEQHFRELLS